MPVQQNRLRAGAHCALSPLTTRSPPLPLSPSPPLSLSLSLPLCQLLWPFNSQGRLKLRVVNGAGQLIAYVRPDTKGPKTSEYNVTPVPDPDSLQLTLSMTLGIKGHVIKERWLYVEWNQLATCPAGLLFTVEILQGHAASHPCSILLSGWQLGSHLPPPFIRALSHVCW